MKMIRHLTIIILLVFQFLQLEAQNCSNINGIITYRNTASTPLYGVQVHLQTMSGEVLQITSTDYLGRYSFCQSSEGTFQVVVTSTRPTGGINSTDALIALRAYMGLGPLTGLTWKAADVNASGYINSTDALLILQRYVGSISTFPAGNWVFETGTVTLSGGNSIILNINGLCYGDLDGTLVPAGCNPIPTTANAGPDQSVTGTSTTLGANTPQNGSGVWSIVSGTGGVVDQPANPASSVNGLPDNFYILTWTISNSCGSTVDTVVITFIAPAFTCGSPLTDTRDGQNYNTVQIGTQCWMKENLNIGSMVTSVITGSNHSDCSNNGIIEKYCYYNDPVNCEIYGGLYDWNEMMQYTTTPGIQGICPAGWHIPTDAEWCTLTTYLDLTIYCFSWGWSGTNAGGKTKETGTTHWYTPNTGATNSSGFTALGAGYRYDYGYFDNLTYYAFFWSSSEISTSIGITRNLYYYNANIGRHNNGKTSGFSLRCIRTY
ncbi:MAG: dockerin type I domain-containing protein [Bacteroidetes bacterium]|nr:dockerin type I domain-containing protein [Bacteroidota bacterium]